MKYVFSHISVLQVVLYLKQCYVILELWFPCPKMFQSQIKIKHSWVRRYYVNSLLYSMFVLNRFSNSSRISGGQQTGNQKKKVLKTQWKEQRQKITTLPTVHLPGLYPHHQLTLCSRLPVRESRFKWKKNFGIIVNVIKRISKLRSLKENISLVRSEDDTLRTHHSARIFHHLFRFQYLWWADCPNRLVTQLIGHPRPNDLTLLPEWRLF